MARPRRSRRTLVIVAVLVLVSVTLITFDERSGTNHLTSGLKSVAHDVFSPIIAGVNDILRPIGDFFAGAVHYGALQAENQRLQATIGQSRSCSCARRRGWPSRSESCGALDHLPFLPDAKTVTAQMISFNLSDFDADITISKGRDEGVTVGEPVVGAGGLVGTGHRSQPQHRRGAAASPTAAPRSASASARATRCTRRSSARAPAARCRSSTSRPRRRCTRARRCTRTGSRATRSRPGSRSG